MEQIKQSMRLKFKENGMKKDKIIDEDYNVPDSKGDIRKIVCSTYETVIEGMRETEQKQVISGYVSFDILYSEQTDGSLEHLEGKYSFEELFDMQSQESMESYYAKLSVEDFTVKIINSRKVNLKALVVVECCQNKICEEELLIDVKDEHAILKKETLSFVQIKACQVDQYRIKEEIELPKTKPNVDYLIWKDVRLKSHETKMLDHCVYIKGDIGVFIIYKAMKEENPIQWYETSFPFEGKIDVSGVDEEMYSFVPLILQETNLSIRPDADGEERMLMVEGMIKADIKAYREEETPMILDLYSCNQHVDVVREEKNYQQILIRNRVKARGYQKFKMGESEEKPLQICYSYGDVHMEKCDISGSEMLAQGYVDTVVVYISTSDEIPMAAMKCQVPFSQKIPLEEDCNPEYQICASIDQINASMIGNDEMEIRVFVDLETLIMRDCNASFIVDIKETPMTNKEIAELPDMVGYIVTEQDSLWDIAKKYKTTVEQLKKYNKKKEDTICKGDKILVVRE